MRKCLCVMMIAAVIAAVSVPVSAWARSANDKFADIYLGLVSFPYEGYEKMPPKMSMGAVTRIEEVQEGMIQLWVVTDSIEEMTLIVEGSDIPAVKLLSAAVSRPGGTYARWYAVIIFPRERKREVAGSGYCLVERVKVVGWFRPLLPDGYEFEDRGGKITAVTFKEGSAEPSELDGEESATRSDMERDIQSLFKGY